jgi:hypothetical protein
MACGMTPANERKAKERKAKRDAGLVRLEIWVYPAMVEPLKSFVSARIAVTQSMWSDRIPFDPGRGIWEASPKVTATA